MVAVTNHYYITHELRPDKESNHLLQIVHNTRPNIQSAVMPVFYNFGWHVGRGSVKLEDLKEKGVIVLDPLPEDADEENIQSFVKILKKCGSVFYVIQGPGPSTNIYYPSAIIERLQRDLPEMEWARITSQQSHFRPYQQERLLKVLDYMPPVVPLAPRDAPVAAPAKVEIPAAPATHTLPVIPVQLKKASSWKWITAASVCIAAVLMILLGREHIFRAFKGLRVS